METNEPHYHTNQNT